MFTVCYDLDCEMNAVVKIIYEIESEFDITPDKILKNGVEIELKDDF
ncbi:MAG: hypothetical protein LBB41_07405 [Prevotellaceae bacterium]|jgi:hypothetical protein|nr:hypothetical protein [Prevotellaceae bacterium]